MVIAFIVVLAIITLAYLCTFRRWNYYIHGSGILVATIGTMLAIGWAGIAWRIWEYGLW